MVNFGKNCFQKKEVKSDMCHILFMRCQLSSQNNGNFSCCFMEINSLLNTIDEKINSLLSTIDITTVRVLSSFPIIHKVGNIVI